MKSVSKKIFVVMFIVLGLFVLNSTYNKDNEVYAANTYYLSYDDCWKYMDSIDNYNDSFGKAIFMNLLSTIPGGEVFAYARNKDALYYKCREAVKQGKGLYVTYNGMSYLGGPPNNIAVPNISYSIG